MYMQNVLAHTLALAVWAHVLFVLFVTEECREG
jgi:hypothetical protein